MTSSRAHLRFDVGGADGRLIGILQDAIAAWGFAARSLFRSFRLSWTKILAIANGPALDSASSLVAAGSSLHHQHIGPSPWLQLASTPFLGPGLGFEEEGRFSRIASWSAHLLQQFGYIVRSFIDGVENPLGRFSIHNLVADPKEFMR